MKRACRRQRPAKAVNEDGDFESLEEEVVHLQRLFRLAEKDTKSYIEETKRIVLRQRKVIAKLEWDKEESRAKLQAENEKAFLLARDKETLAGLTKTRARLLESVKEAKQYFSFQDNEICKLRQEIHRLNRRVLRGKSANVSEDSQKRIKLLEDRMQTAAIQLNRMLHLNVQSRETIEHLLKQLAKYSKLRDQLDQELRSHQNEIDRLTIDAAKAFEDRDRASSRLRYMQETGMKEKAENRNQVKEIQRYLSQEKQQVRFLSVKALSQLTEEELRMDQESRLKVMKKKREQTRKMVESYDAAIRSFRAVSGKDDLEAMVKHYFDIRASNAAIFNFVSDLNNKVDTLKERIQELRKDVGSPESSFDGVTVSGSENDMAVVDLRPESQPLPADSSRTTGVRKVLRKVQDMVNHMLTIVYGHQGETTSVAPVGSPEENDDDIKANILTMLALVEQQVNELFRIRQFVRDGDRISVDHIKPKGAVLRSLASTNSNERSACTVSSVDLVSIPFPSIGSETEVDSTSSPEAGGNAHCRSARRTRDGVT